MGTTNGLPRMRDAGFGLIEVVVVVALIGILTAVFVPSYVGLQNGSRENATKSDLAANRTAIIGWGIDNAGLVPVRSTFDPSVAGQDLDAYGWSISDQTRPFVASDYWTNTTTAPTKFCLQLESTTGRIFRISSKTDPELGTCSDLPVTGY